MNALDVIVFVPLFEFNVIIDSEVIDPFLDFKIYINKYLRNASFRVDSKI